MARPDPRPPTPASTRSGSGGRLLPLQLGLGALSGVLYFLSWIGFGVWPLAFVCFLPLLWALRGATPGQALRLGAWMGFVTHLGGYTWVIHLLTVFADAPMPLALLGYLAICAAQGLLFGVCAFLLRRAWTRTSAPLWQLLPLALCATEWAYPMLFQSFTGVALMPALALVQIADLGGVLLLTGLQALVNGALFDVLEAALEAEQEAAIDRPQSRRRALAAAGAALVAISASGGYGVWALRRQAAREAAAPRRTIGIAQPNVGEIELHQRPQASVEALQEQTSELRARGAQLVVWPEGGYNTRLLRLGSTEPATAVTGGTPVPIVVGAGRFEPPRRVWNSAILVGADGRLGDHYDKIELLAFGEYIPFGDWFPILYKWSPMSSALQRGSTTAPLRDGPWRLALSICYEDILPGTVRATMQDHGAGLPHVLVNQTNDSWYGAGHEQEQHLMLAAVRSIEHRRWLVRATSTGTSAFVDSVGRVLQRIEPGVRGVALRPVPMLEGRTLFGRLGSWPGPLSVALLTLLWLARRRRPV